MGKPQGVRIHRRDTDEWIDCELIHVGENAEGFDCWRIAGVIFRPDVDDLHVQHMPGNTAIGFEAPELRRNGGSVEVQWEDP